MSTYRLSRTRKTYAKRTGARNWFNRGTLSPGQSVPTSASGQVGEQPIRRPNGTGNPGDSIKEDAK